MDKTLTAIRLRELLLYYHDTGIFTRRICLRGNRKGSIAGSLTHEGYIAICVDYKKHPAHRLAWLCATGQWPAGDIDHINGNRSDNRLANLRDVARSVNLQNQRKATGRNASGLLGVSLHKETGKWAARIQVLGKQKHLGYFNSPELAHEAYLIEKRICHTGCTI
jgi:hypothetical protein